MLVSWRVVRVTIGKARDGIEFILEKLPVDFALQSFNLRCLWWKLMHHHKFTSKKIATQQCPMRLWHHVYKSHSFDQTPNWVCTWTFMSGCQLNPKGWWRLTPWNGNKNGTPTWRCCQKGQTTFLQKGILFPIIYQVIKWTIPVSCPFGQIVWDKWEKFYPFHPADIRNKAQQIRVSPGTPDSGDPYHSHPSMDSFGSGTVDGRNPKQPPEMHKIL